MKRTTFVLAASLLVCLVLAAAGRPDYNGTWKLNTGRSTQDGPADRVLIDVIEQQGLNIKVTTQGGATGDSLLFEGAFQANGKPRIVKVEKGRYRYTKVAWEAATLVFEITEKDGTKEFSKTLKGLRESWAISPDGKVLTKFRRTAQNGQIADQKYVFDKQ